MKPLNDIEWPLQRYWINKNNYASISDVTVGKWENKVQMSQRNREPIGDLQSCDNITTTHVQAPLDMAEKPFCFNVSIIMVLNDPKNDDVPDEMFEKIEYNALAQILPASLLFSADFLSNTIFWD